MVLLNHKTIGIFPYKNDVHYRWSHREPLLWEPSQSNRRETSSKIWDGWKHIEKSLDYRKKMQKVGFNMIYISS